MQITSSLYQNSYSLKSKPDTIDKKADFTAEIKSDHSASFTSNINPTSAGITHLGPMSSSVAAMIAGIIQQPSRVADNDPSNTYATIQKNGQVVATFDKSGGMMTPNGTSIPTNLVDGDRGTSLADARIKQMLAALGGQVVYK